MKWILLFLYISCGKHTEPRLLDIQDKDGDLISNYKEDQLNKYVADLEMIKKVSGVIRFHQNEVIEIEFTNEFNLKDLILDQMTKRDKPIKEDPYFSEWENLKLKKKVNVSLKKLQYQVQLKFDSDSDHPDELILRTEKSEASLGRWSESMNLELSRDVLSNLLSGKSDLLIRKNLIPEKIKSIKEKTFKLYFHTKDQSKIMYVSKELNLNKIKDLLLISNSRSYVEEELFFEKGHSELPQWYHRELKNGDKFLVEISPNEMNKAIKSHFIVKDLTLERSNGKASQPLSLSNPNGAKVYLRLHTFTQTLRTFFEKSEKLNHGYGGGAGAHGNGPDKVNCTHYMRYIQSEFTLFPSINTLFQNLRQPEVFEKSNITEQINGNEVFWEMSIDDLPENMVFSIIDLEEQSYTITGEYSNSCAHLTSQERKSAFKTNPEGKLSIQIESFVEKVL